jgi:aryl-alcohol dehydrogenase-like predicted oxidoreductase
VTFRGIALGCGNFGGVGSSPAFFGQGTDEETAFAIMDAAWARGIRWFDTADAYGGGRSEATIGRWIAARGVRPAITTKTFNPMDRGADHGLAPERIERQLASSLERLGVDRVELYLAHEYDPDVPLADTFAAFEALPAIEAYGVSNFDADQLRGVFELALPSLVQNSYSLLERGDEEEVLELCRHFDVCYTPFGPLAGGLLTGKYKNGEPPPPGSRLATRPGPYAHLLTDETFAKLRRFIEIAAGKGVSPATLAIAWLLAQPAVTAVVVGPRRIEHLEPAVAALECELSREDADAIAALF